MDKKTLSERAAEKRREYKRQHYAKNREKYSEYARRYWERQGLKDTGTNKGDEI